MDSVVKWFFFSVLPHTRRRMEVDHQQSYNGYKDINLFKSNGLNGKSILRIKFNYRNGLTYK